jgi:acetyl esterase/lipase
VVVGALCIGIPTEAQSIPASVEFQRDVAYRPMGAEWRLDYAKPKTPGGLLPAVVVIHGGGWIEGDKSSYDQLIVDWAGLGFFAMTINYRLGSAERAAFPEAIEDCKCAVRWLRAHAKEFGVDKDRIGAYGSSAGGHLAMMLGILGGDFGKDYEGDGPYRDQSSDVGAVVSDSGIVSLDAALPGNGTLRRAFNWFLGGSPPLGDIVRKASPMTYAERGAHLPPFLLIYGSIDTQVPIAITEEFVQKLCGAGHKELEYIRYDGVDHCPFFMQNAPGARTKVEQFLVRTLQKQER